jgi:nucleotide-binding universal stress UspA family protein
MFRRILVPTDLTERATKALDVAIQLRAPRGARITLLHVIETGGLSANQVKPLYRKLERRAQRMMATATARLPRTDVRVAQKIVYGDRAAEIVRFASAHDTDLIVLASHPLVRSAGVRDWGTISYKVGILAACPVLLVK